MRKYQGNFNALQVLYAIVYKTQIAYFYVVMWHCTARDMAGGKSP